MSASLLPVTLVPCPALSGGLGPEVGAAHVHDAGGEAQQAAVSVGPGHSGGRGRQAVLLIGAGQQVEGAVLQVGRLLDQLSIQDQVGSSCRARVTVKRKCIYIFCLLLHSSLSKTDICSTHNATQRLTVKDTAFKEYFPPKMTIYVSVTQTLLPLILELT